MLRRFGALVKKNKETKVRFIQNWPKNTLNGLMEISNGTRFNRVNMIKSQTKFSV